MNNPKTQAKLNTRHRTKSHKENNTILKTKRMSNTQTPSKTRSVVPFSYETHVMLLKTGTIKLLSAIEEIKKSSLNGENIHCMLRN
jgi:hypothetical protein